MIGMQAGCLTCNYNMLCVLFDRNNAYVGMCELYKKEYLIALVDIFSTPAAIIHVNTSKCAVVAKLRGEDGELRHTVRCAKCPTRPACQT